MYFNSLFEKRREDEVLFVCLKKNCFFCQKYFIVVFVGFGLLMWSVLGWLC